MKEKQTCQRCGKLVYRVDKCFVHPVGELLACSSCTEEIVRLRNGKVMACLKFRVGDKVRPGPDYRPTPKFQGVVLSEPDDDGFIRVQWDFSYMFKDGVKTDTEWPFKLELVPPLIQLAETLEDA